MANPQNLRPFDSNQNREQARAAGKKGGVKSGEARRAKKTLQKIVQEWGDQKASETNIAALEKLGITGESATQKATLIIPLLRNAKDGNMKAMQLMLELLNENAKQNAEVARIEAETEKLRIENEILRKQLNEENGSDMQVVIIDNIPEDGEEYAKQETNTTQDTLNQEEW